MLDLDLVDGTFVTIACVRAHQEAPRRNANEFEPDPCDLYGTGGRSAGAGQCDEQGTNKRTD